MEWLRWRQYPQLLVEMDLAPELKQGADASLLP